MCPTSFLSGLRKDPEGLATPYLNIHKTKLLTTETLVLFGASGAEALNNVVFTAEKGFVIKVLYI